MSKDDPTKEEAEQMIPRLGAVKFSSEKRAFTADISAAQVYGMLTLDGWKIVGWAYSRDVEARDDCPYVGLFEDEDGHQFWCHVSEFNFTCMARKMGLKADEAAS